MSKTDLTDATSKCPICDKAPHPLPFKQGDNEGVSGTLANNMLGGNATAKIKLHKLYAGPDSVDAHHIIIEKSMQGEPWATYVHLCGYDINDKKNGVFLTSRKDVACKLRTPLHTTSHSSGNNAGKTYAAMMTEKVKNIEKKFTIGHYCENGFDSVKEELETISKTTLKDISDFIYELSKNGRDYMEGGRGCGCGDRKHAKIIGTEISPEIWVRKELDLHGKKNKSLKNELIELFTIDYGKEFHPSVNKPDLVIGE